MKVVVNGAKFFQLVLHEQYDFCTRNEEKREKRHYIDIYIQAEDGDVHCQKAFSESEREKFVRFCENAFNAEVVSMVLDLEIGDEYFHSLVSYTALVNGKTVEVFLP